jgi:hypothetical protein
MSYLYECRTIVAPILLLVAAILALYTAGVSHSILLTLSYAGALAVVFGNLLYVVVISRVSWPGAPWHERLGRILGHRR